MSDRVMAESKSERFAALLLSIARGVSRLEREQVCCGELTFQQFDTMRRIEQNESDTVSSIAAALAIDDSTASRNVAVLARDGYLKKKRDPNDGRAVRLVLTSKGRAVLSELRCDERDVFAAVYERFSPSERIAITAALGSLEVALQQDLTECCAPSDSEVRAKSAR